MVKWKLLVRNEMCTPVYLLTSCFGAISKQFVLRNKLAMQFFSVENRRIFHIAVILKLTREVKGPKEITVRYIVATFLSSSWGERNSSWCDWQCLINHHLSSDNNFIHRFIGQLQTRKEEKMLKKPPKTSLTFETINTDHVIHFS